jgi:hypothetical protein
VIDKVRVSCGGLCRVPHPVDGRLLLGLNRNALKRGVRVLKPLGGALAYHALPPDLNATPENPSKRELRLFLPEPQVEPFAAWFATRQDRETSPFRELREELVGEHQVLPALSPSDVTITYERTVRAQRLSDRIGATGVLTHSFQEVYTVRLAAPDVRERLLSAPPESGLLWVSEDQIRSGRYDDQTAIQAKTLLGPT